MNTKEFFDAEIERYLLISGTNTEDSMVIALKHAAKSLPPEASEEELQRTFAKIFAEQLRLINKPADGSVVVSENLANILETVRNFLNEHHWEHQVLPFGNDVILHQVPLFSNSLGVTIHLDIAVKENPNICDINAHIPYEGLPVSEDQLDSLVRIVNSDPNKKFGALVYNCHSKQLSYTYQMITNYGLHEIDLDMAVVEILFQARTIYETVKELACTNAQAAELPSRIDAFIREFKQQTKDLAFYTISTRKLDGARIFVDKEGFIWIRHTNRATYVRTTVNIEHSHFAADGCGGQEGIYVVCKDGTGLHFAEDDIYYLIDEEYSGYGPAFDHFTQFPNGDSREESARIHDAMLQWAIEHPQEKD